MIIVLIVLFIIVFPFFIQFITWLFLVALVFSVTVAVLGSLRPPR